MIGLNIYSSIGSGKRNISHFELFFNLVYYLLGRVIRIIVILVMVAVAVIKASTMLRAMRTAV